MAIPSVPPNFDYGSFIGGIIGSFVAIMVAISLELRRDRRDKWSLRENLLVNGKRYCLIVLAIALDKSKNPESREILEGLSRLEEFMLSYHKLRSRSWIKNPKECDEIIRSLEKRLSNINVFIKEERYIDSIGEWINVENDIHKILDNEFYRININRS